eukprot:gnl/TRDRNA2_/TRDRNA2_161424_c0_seq2.p1 gnl/TRDRNA2_/TRDRNA2_161424_c0~~gnl/TRDRNA2_/TRDRNA2_161424_c0_seq2.p1  ORF type:complete len:191 (+),score=57.19 gnl/TRDRNA2_/TRDRNA2_161424_c0_seq2:99-671(+)
MRPWAWTCLVCIASALAAGGSHEGSCVAGSRGQCSTSQLLHLARNRGKTLEHLQESKKALVAEMDEKIDSLLEKVEYLERSLPEGKMLDEHHELEEIRATLIELVEQKDELLEDSKDDDDDDEEDDSEDDAEEDEEQDDADGVEKDDEDVADLLHIRPGTKGASWEGDKEVSERTQAAYSSKFLAAKVSN